MPSPVDVSEPKQLLARSGPCAFGGGDELLPGGLLGEDLLGPVERRGSRTAGTPPVDSPSRPLLPLRTVPTIRMLAAGARKRGTARWLREPRTWARSGVSGVHRGTCLCGRTRCDVDSYASRRTVRSFGAVLGSRHPRCCKRTSENTPSETVWKSETATESGLRGPPRRYLGTSIGRFLAPRTLG